MNNSVELFFDQINDEFISDSELRIEQYSELI